MEADGLNGELEVCSLWRYEVTIEVSMQNDASLLSVYSRSPGSLISPRGESMDMTTAAVRNADP